MVKEYHRAEELALRFGDECAGDQREVAEIMLVEVGGDRTNRFLWELAHPKNAKERVRAEYCAMDFVPSPHGFLVGSCAKRCWNLPNNR